MRCLFLMFEAGQFGIEVGHPIEMMHGPAELRSLPFL
jgi:hypothetical protein